MSTVGSAAAGCCVSHLMRLYYVTHDDDADKKKSKNAHQCDLVWNKFQSYLQTPEFVEFCKMEGIIDPSITLCQKSTSLWDAFVSQLDKDTHNGTSIQLGVVFHGTAKSNILSILKSGLDPKRRSGQAYGIGEYFSKNPSTSLSYCQGDNQMLVYCVVIPSETNSKFPNKPQDFVVVEKTHHQMPIAVLEFSGASAEAIRRSQAIRHQLQHLNQLAQKAEAATNEAKCKSQIIQLLFTNELQGAAHKFRTAFPLFSNITKLEISYWAHKHADADVVQYYFNNSADDNDEEIDESLFLLPPPPDWNTFQNGIVSVEAQQAKLNEAWAKIKQCQEKLKAEVDRNISTNNTINNSTNNSTTINNNSNNNNNMTNAPATPPSLPSSSISSHNSTTDRVNTGSSSTSSLKRQEEGTTAVMAGCAAAAKSTPTITSTTSKNAIASPTVSTLGSISSSGSSTSSTNGTSSISSSSSRRFTFPWTMASRRGKHQNEGGTANDAVGSATKSTSPTDFRLRNTKTSSTTSSSSSSVLHDDLSMVASSSSSVDTITKNKPHIAVMKTEQEEDSN